MKITMKKPVYEVEVLASTSTDGYTYNPIKVLTLDDCYEENHYVKLEPIGYIEIIEEQ